MAQSFEEFWSSEERDQIPAMSQVTQGRRWLWRLLWFLIALTFVVGSVEFGNAFFGVFLLLALGLTVACGIPCLLDTTELQVAEGMARRKSPGIDMYGLPAPAGVLPATGLSCS